MNRHVAPGLVVIGFGLAALGALTPSYLHLADWWRAWMPEDWQHLAYVAALVTEAVIVACGLSRALALRSSDDGYWRVVALEVAAVALSIYVNARWGAAHADGDGVWRWLDIVAGAAALPLFAVASLEVMGIVLRVVRTPAERQVKVQAGVEEPVELAQWVAPVVRHVAPGASSPERQTQPASTTLADRWHQAVAQFGTTNASEIARQLGVSGSAVRNWRKAAQEG